MNQWVYCNGEIRFEMDPFYVNCLEGIVATFFYRNPPIKIEKDKITFHGSFEDAGITSSIFVFIKKYGTLISGEVIVTKEEYYPHVFHVKEGDVWQWKYGHSKQNLEAISLQKFAEIHNSDSLRNILSDYEEQSEELNDGMADLFEHKKINEHNLKRISETIMSALKPSESILLHYGNNSIRISPNGFWKSKLTVVKKESLESFVQKDTILFDSNLFFSKTEKRKIVNREDQWYPLIEPLMVNYVFDTNTQGIPDIKNVLLEDGMKVNACTLCSYRLRKIINGCKTCRPILKSRKDEGK